MSTLSTSPRFGLIWRLWISSMKTARELQRAFFSRLFSLLPLAGFSSSGFISSKPQIKFNFDQRIPPRSWDSHMHVLDPRFPLSPDAIYKPQWHTLRDANAFESSVGVDNIVLVQPSIYGNDNSCLLDALKALGPHRARGVVTFDPAKTPTLTLKEWHSMGVRAVRVNLQSVGKVMDKSTLAETLKAFADAVRPLEWVVQVYVPIGMVPLLESIVPELDIVLCIDHMGHPPLAELNEYARTQEPNTIPGFDALLRLLKGGKTYVKLSAPYRMSIAKDGVTDLIPIGREILRAAPNRVVFATDWPHTRYEGLDIRPWIQTALDICGDDEVMVKKLFRDNAEELWGVKQKL